MKKLSAETVLRNIIELLLYYLHDLNNIEDLDKEQFRYGEKTAYVECLEVIQQWERAAEHGLDFDIEAKFLL